MLVNVYLLCVISVLQGKSRWRTVSCTGRGQGGEGQKCEGRFIMHHSL